ncbi:hypothetical protein MD537_21310, partial [Flavihumibacter sediminis]|nr:hypothetical protein [Flavihumibacter sediminis]
VSLRGIVSTLTNASAIVSNEGSGEGNKNNIAVIIDENDIEEAEGVLEEYRSIALITGLTAGTHKIIPAALLSENYEVVYVPANLTINKSKLTIGVSDKTYSYGTVDNNFDTTV